MQKYKVAHIKEQGQDMVIIPLENRFEFKTSVEQEQVRMKLQASSQSAGLKGTVVLVWKYGRSFKFIAPRPWQNFFKSISFELILSNLNKELTIH